MSKTIAVVQSNYIPWRGYFDLINSVDEFILFDDVQYTRRDWRNRNAIKSSAGLFWLTIPVQVKGKYLQKIKDTEVTDDNWAREHWMAIIHNYSKAKHFSAYREVFEDLYSRSGDKLLSQINHRFIVAICRILGIRTKISWSMDYNLIGDKTERLVDLCQQAGATGYFSGPSAKAYLNENLFGNENIAVSYMDYSGYQELNALRARTCADAKAKGYTLISYVHPQSGLPTDCEYGENCFIMNNVLIHPRVKLGNDVFVWSGAMIGHHSTIGDHCWLTSCANISGVVTVGKNCFFAVNATVGHNVVIGDECFIGANALVTKCTENRQVFLAESAKPFRLDSHQFLRMSKFAEL